MTEPSNVPPPPRRRPGMQSLRRSGQLVGAAIFAWFIIFIPTFLAGGAAFEDAPLPWWSWPAVGLAAVLCAAYAWKVRRSKPPIAAGALVGIALGLLHAGTCFAEA